MTNLRLVPHRVTRNTNSYSPIGLQKAPNGTVNICVSKRPIPESIKKQMSTLKQSSKMTKGGRYSGSISRTPSNFGNQQITRSQEMRINGSRTSVERSPLVIESVRDSNHRRVPPY